MAARLPKSTPTLKTLGSRAAVFLVKSLLLPVLVTLPAACGEGTGPSTSPENASRADASVPAQRHGEQGPAPTASLRLILTPTLASLPLLYADALGMLDSLARRQGLRVTVTLASSGADADTALWAPPLPKHGSHRADRAPAGLRAGITDDVRLARRFQLVPSLRERVQQVLTPPFCYALVASGRLRMRQVQSLVGRTIAASRHSVSNELLQEHGPQPYVSDDALRPQINDYRLRQAMLDEAQVDAAFLPEPWATAARLRGHTVLWRSQPAEKRTRLVIVRQGAEADGLQLARRAQTLLLQAWKQAADSLGAAPSRSTSGVVRHIFTDKFRLPAQVADSVKLPRW